MQDLIVELSSNIEGAPSKIQLVTQPVPSKRNFGKWSPNGTPEVPSCRVDNVLALDQIFSHAKPDATVDEGKIMVDVWRNIFRHASKETQAS